eukprot:Gb_15276 [translate_table: standard]
MGSALPNAALKPFPTANIHMNLLFMVNSLPGSVHYPLGSIPNSSFTFHQKSHRTPKSNGSRRKWRIMADNDVVAEESTSVEETQEKAGPKQPSGKGFGPSSGRKESVSTGGGSKGSKGKKKSSVVRRAPPENPLILPQGNPQVQQVETVFLISWAGLGILILVEGIVLAASGFLPEEWDNFFVKYLYPVFTPSVLLFLVGATAYGLFKYLAGGPPKK